MRPRRAMGRPGTTVIPAAWSAEHAAVIAKALLSSVQIGLLGEPAWDADAKEDRAQLEFPVYDGPAELMLVADSNRTVVTAGEQIPAPRYDVMLTADGTEAITSTMYVLVVECDDGRLIGQMLPIEQVEAGSQRFSRVVRAVFTG